MKSFFGVSGIFACWLLLTPICTYSQVLVKAIPNQTLPITYYTYMGEFEVTTGEWKTFLDAILNDSSATLFDKMQPDTLLLAKEWKITDAGAYFFDKKYTNFPVVAVSWEQANQYCKWLTQVWNYKQATNYDPKNFKKVEIRLPTREEWQKAADAGKRLYPWGFDAKVQKAKGSLQCFETANNLLEVKTVNVNSFKHYAQIPKHMHGNVAEMVNSKGVALGGSYKDPLTQCSAYSRQTYYETSVFVGFRILLEVIEE